MVFTERHCNLQCYAAHKNRLNRLRGSKCRRSTMEMQAEKNSVETNFSKHSWLHTIAGVHPCSKHSGAHLRLQMQKLPPRHSNDNMEKKKTKTAL